MCYIRNCNVRGTPTQEAVPGNVRKAKHFIMFMRTVVEYFKKTLKGKNVTQFGKWQTRQPAL